MKFYLNLHRKLSTSKLMVLLALATIFVMFGFYFVLITSKNVGFLLIVVGFIAMYDILISFTKWYKHYLYVDIKEDKLILRVRYFNPELIISWKELSKIQIIGRRIYVWHSDGKIMFNVRKFNQVEYKRFVKNLLDSAIQHNVKTDYR